MLPVTSRKASSSESPSTQVRELAEDHEHLRGDLAVAPEARRHDDRLRAAPERLAHRHRGMHAEAAHLVARGRDDAASAGAADDHRLAGELGPVALLDGRVERVHVHVQDDPVRAHDSSDHGVDQARQHRDAEQHEVDGADDEELQRGQPTRPSP